MSAAEVARELGLTHANASYHLRQLLAAGQLVEAGEETHPRRPGQALPLRRRRTGRAGRETVSEPGACSPARWPTSWSGAATWMDPSVKGAEHRRRALGRPATSGRPRWPRSARSASGCTAAPGRRGPTGAVHVSLTLSLFAMTDPSAAEEPS